MARLEYPQVRAGLILMMDRTFDARQNEIIVDKAIHWSSRGVVGVDIAGPRPGGLRYDYTQLAPMVETAREAGLGVTIHVGEEGASGAEEIGEVVEALRPERIGHGILAARDPELMALLARGGRDARDLPHLEPAHEGATRRGRVRETFQRFVEHAVPFTIATDGPEMMRTHLRDEFELLLRIGALTDDELRHANERGHAAAVRQRRRAPGGSFALGGGGAVGRVGWVRDGVLRALGDVAGGVARSVRGIARRVARLVAGAAELVLRVTGDVLHLFGGVAGRLLRPAEQPVEESHGASLRRLLVLGQTGSGSSPSSLSR